MSKLQSIMEKRAKIHADAVVLMNKEEQTAETRAQVTAMLADVDLLGNDIKTIQRADAQAAELAQKTGAIVPENRGTVTPADEYRSAYMEWLLQGKPGSRGACKG